MSGDENDTMREIGERIEEMQRVRGWYLSSYAQIEFLLGAFVVVSLGMPEYTELGDDLPHQIGKRIKRLETIVGMEGPLSNYRVFIEHVLKRFSERLEVRNLLAHGYSDYVLGGQDAGAMRFRKWHRERERQDDILVLQRTLSLEEFKREAREVGELAKEVVASLGNIENEFQSAYDR